jgi:carbonic anhydrase
MRTIRLTFAMLVVACWVLVSIQSDVCGAGPSNVVEMNPQEALSKLMAGNERFQNDKTGHPLLHSKRREELVGGQSPFAVILSCSDSRVPPEIIFDQGLGGLFVVRLAGNTVTRAGLETVDYAVSNLGTNLIMVLGHDSCGAVKGALDECSGKAHEKLPEIFANICPAVQRAREKSPADLYSSTIDLNVAEQVKLLKGSSMFNKRLAAGTLKIVGARYDLESGKVKLLDTGD